MAVEFESKNPGATREQLRALSQVVGAVPASYSRFLTTHNGVVPAWNWFQARPSRTASVRRVFGCDEALLAWKQMHEELGPGILPIAEAEGGNLVCLALGDGTVHYWDHDYWGAEGLSVVAASLDEFIEALREGP